eukprot:CAMPEP_0178437214 /NCGR_PEP_ID=MMETSP0689_2-20121128/34860_1 /TAXON_ID=160604 /ORGANISM="Amphidinium massartii, Strain CS-259" /LENGTH=60 /DNA_ID=CAMNT_0020059375 /DNA_START=188 /DNA_END=370 /DNA_ORIENTATION=-
MAAAQDSVLTCNDVNAMSDSCHLLAHVRSLELYHTRGNRGPRGVNPEIVQTDVLLLLQAL